MISLVLICFAELSPISKTLNSTAREKACETVLAQACRHAPTLLDYKPSYKGVLKKKDGEPSGKEQQKKGNQPATGVTQKKKRGASNAEGAKEKRQRGVRLPKIRYTAEEWLTPLGADIVFEPTIPGFNAPLRLVEPSTEDMSRRGIPRPVIPSKLSNPAKSGGPSDKEQQPREKRQKTAADTVQSSVSQAIPLEGSRASDPKEKERELKENPHLDLTDPEPEAAIWGQFSPSYTMPDGRVLLLNDSVKEETNLAVTLLRGLALPRDYDQVPTDLIPGLGEMCPHLVQVDPFA